MIDIDNMALALAKRISKQKARQYKLDADNLQSYLLEKYCSNIRPKLISAKNQEHYKPRAYIIKSFNGYSLNFIRDCSKPISVNRSMKDLYMQERAILKRRPDATDSQISLECNCSVEELQGMRKCMKSVFMSLDAMPFEPIIEDTRETYSEAQQSIYAELAKLSDEDFAIAEDFFIHDKKQYSEAPVIKYIRSLLSNQNNKP